MSKSRIVTWIAVLAAFCTGMSMGQELRWFKGNTHAHTTKSDGDALPRQAVRWYQDHEYNFLVITDHDHLTPVRTLDTDPADDFLLIAGEELGASVQKKPVHVCGINLGREVASQRGETIAEALQKDIDTVRAAGGIPQINHPNWKWAFTDAEMRGLRDVRLLEVINANRDCNNAGAGGRPGTEEIWDRLLTGGMRIWAVATDDTHTYFGDWTPEKACPGRGWIVVRAAELTPAAVTGALERGDFYASTGVVLKEVRAGEKEYAVEVEPESDFTYSVRFIGREGRLLQEVHGTKAAYAVRGDEGYVRVKVVCSSGEVALTQPVFVGKAE